jgi:hypothetical protein
MAMGCQALAELQWGSRGPVQWATHSSTHLPAAVSWEVTKSWSLVARTILSKVSARLRAHVELERKPSVGKAESHCG